MVLMDDIPQRKDPSVKAVIASFLGTLAIGLLLYALAVRVG
jgi:hypothetical protein